MKRLLILLLAAFSLESNAQRVEGPITTLNQCEFSDRGMYCSQREKRCYYEIKRGMRNGTEGISIAMMDTHAPYGERIRFIPLMRLPLKDGDSWIDADTRWSISYYMADGGAYGSLNFSGAGTGMHIYTDPDLRKISRIKYDAVTSLWSLNYKCDFE